MEFVLVVIVNPGGIPAGSDRGTCTGPDVVVDTLLSEWLLFELGGPLLLGELLLLLFRFDELLEPPPPPPLVAAISSFNRLVM